MSNDPVWLADNVMAFLLDRQGDAPDKSLLPSKIEAYYDGKAFPFTFRFGHVAWSETTGQDYGVVVALDEHPVLHVDLYSVVWKAHLPNTPFTLSAPSRMASGRACLRRGYEIRRRQQGRGETE